MPEETTPPATKGEDTATGTTTRQQHRKNADEREAADDTEVSNDQTRKKDRNVFKGKIDKMGGNVFQLSEEGRKGNQFTLTLEALHNYANIELDHAEDLASFFKDPCTDAKVTPPDDEPPLTADGKTRVKRDHRLYIAWKFECESYNERVTTLRNNKLKLFTVILLQCSQSVKMKVEATSGYEKSKVAYDCEWLITTLKNICHRFEHTEDRYLALIHAKQTLYAYYQSAGQTTTDYYDSFRELLSVVESYGGQIHDTETAAPDSAKIGALTPEQKVAHMRGHCCGKLLLCNADPSRYELLRLELSNSFSKGRDEYPTTLTDA